MNLANPIMPVLPSVSADALIEVYRDGKMQTRIAFSNDGVTIGRVSDCDVMLDDPIVSRHHARIDSAGSDRWRIADLKSHNGTFVNGKLQPQAFITFGDRVEIGPFTLVFRRCSSPRLDTDRTRSRLLDQLTFSDDLVSLNSLQEIQPPMIAVDQLKLFKRFQQVSAGRCGLAIPAGCFVPVDAASKIGWLVVGGGFGGWIIHQCRARAIAAD